MDDTLREKISLFLAPPGPRPITSDVRITQEILTFLSQYKKSAAQSVFSNSEGNVWITYDSLYVEPTHMDNLVVLCRDCHEIHHGEY